jgi:hypothetical protein
MTAKSTRAFMAACAIARRFGLYVRDFGNGNLCVTHVFWAN